MAEWYLFYILPKFGLNILECSIKMSKQMYKEQNKTVV